MGEDYGSQGQVTRRTRHPPQTRLESLGSSHTWIVLLFPAMLAFAFLVIHPVGVANYTLVFEPTTGTTTCPAQFYCVVGAADGTTTTTARILLKRPAAAAKYLSATVALPALVPSVVAINTRLALVDGRIEGAGLTTGVPLVQETYAYSYNSTTRSSSSCDYGAHNRTSTQRPCDVVSMAYSDAFPALRLTSLLAAGARGSHWRALLEITVHVNATGTNAGAGADTSILDAPQALHIALSTESPTYTVFSNVLGLFLSALVATVGGVYVSRLRENLAGGTEDRESVVAVLRQAPWAARLLPEQLAVAGVAAALLGYLSPLTCILELLQMAGTPDDAAGHFPAVPEVSLGPPGNASSIWRGPDIQAHQPPLAERLLQVRLGPPGNAACHTSRHTNPLHPYTHQLPKVRIGPPGRRIPRRHPGPPSYITMPTAGTEPSGGAFHGSGVARCRVADCPLPPRHTRRRAKIQPAAGAVAAAAVPFLSPLPAQP